MKQLANPLSHQSTVAKWLVITQQETLGKSLMKQLAISLSNQKTVAKWLVIEHQKTMPKSLVSFA
jgi:hypothetical protein